MTEEHPRRVGEVPPERRTEEKPEGIDPDTGPSGAPAESDSEQGPSGSPPEPVPGGGDDRDD